MSKFFSPCFTYLLLFCLLQSCYRLHRSQGGGQLSYEPQQRQTDPADVLLPEGYAIEVMAEGLSRDII